MQICLPAEDVERLALNSLRRSELRRCMAVVTTGFAIAARHSMQTCVDM